MLGHVSGQREQKVLSWESEGIGMDAGSLDNSFAIWCVC